MAQNKQTQHHLTIEFLALCSWVIIQLLYGDIFDTDTGSGARFRQIVLEREVVAAHLRPNIGSNPVDASLQPILTKENVDTHGFPSSRAVSDAAVYKDKIPLERSEPLDSFDNNR